jgi:hypothetical protein
MLCINATNQTYLQTLSWLHHAGAIELRNALASTFSLHLPSTLVFDYPTTSSLAAFIHTQLAQAAGLAAADGWEGGTYGHDAVRLSNASGGWPRQSTSPSQTSSGMVAINAMVQRLPGDPPDVLAAADAVRDTARATPFFRWDVDSGLEGVPKRPGARFGRFLEVCEGRGGAVRGWVCRAKVALMKGL